MIRIIAGLGNTGTRYEGTRHNIGFAVVDECAERYRTGWRIHKKTGCQVAEVTIAQQKIYLIKPLGFMNECGRPIGQCVRYLNVPLDALCVVHDELDLDFGQISLKKTAGDNGHNGLRSITRCTSGQTRAETYRRLQVGIGRPPHSRTPVASWVLSPLSKKENKELPFILSDAVDLLEEHIIT